MNKIFTLVAAVVLSVAVAQAQDAGPKNGGRATVAQQDATLTQRSSAKKAPQKAMELKTGEHMMGYYITDDVPSIWRGLTNYPGTNYRAGTCFETQVTERFVGGQITRFRYCLGESYDAVGATMPTPIKGYFICEFGTNYNLMYGYSPLVEHVYGTPLEQEFGWHEVELEESEYVTIQANKHYVIGYIYDQTEYNYPFCTDGTLDVDYYSTYGMFVYGYITSTYGTDWYYFDSDGTLCIQAVVTGGDFGDYDISLRNFKVDSYAEEDGIMSYSFVLTNYGLEELESYTIVIEIDGQVVDTIDTPIEDLSGSGSTYYGTVQLPDDIAASSEEHTIRAYVATINGEVPTEYTDDDTVEDSFYVYSESVERQKHLIEHFTSTYCTSCPYGYQLIELLTENNPDKYAWVALHSSGMGSDPYYISYVQYPEYYFVTLTTGYSYALPSAVFDRIYLDDPSLDASGAVALILGFNESDIPLAAEYINNDIDRLYASIPAFVTVDFDAEINNGAMTLTVSGSGVEYAKQMLDGYVLNVYIVEDGLTGSQYGSNDNNFAHRNTLRYVPTGNYGDDINWTSDSEYSNTYTFELSKAWKYDNCKVVAFISKSIISVSGVNVTWADPWDAYVNNCNEEQLSNIADGIGIAVADLNSVESKRYTIDGRQITTPTKGINLVKSTDGSVKKVIVK